MSLNISNYNLQNIMCFGLAQAHLSQSCQGSLGNRVVHVLLGSLEWIPLIGQIVALFETMIVLGTKEPSTTEHPIKEESTPKRKNITTMEELEEAYSRYRKSATNPSSPDIIRQKIEEFYELHKILIQHAGNPESFLEAIKVWRVGSMTHYHEKTPNALMGELQLIVDAFYQVIESKGIDKVAELLEHAAPCFQGMGSALQAALNEDTSIFEFFPNLDPTNSPVQRVGELLRAYRNVTAKEILSRQRRDDSIDGIMRFINDIDNDFDKKYVNMDLFVKWCTDNRYIGDDSVRVYRKAYGWPMLFADELRIIAHQILNSL